MAQPLHNEDKLTVHGDPNTLIVVKRARRSTRSGLHQHDGVALRSIRPAREQPSAQRCRGRTGTRSSRPHHFSTFRRHHHHHHHLSWPSAFSLPLPLVVRSSASGAPPPAARTVACSRAQQSFLTCCTHAQWSTIIDLDLRVYGSIPWSIPQSPAPGSRAGTEFDDETKSSS